jgi:hypothetical protein
MAGGRICPAGGAWGCCTACTGGGMIFVTEGPGERAGGLYPLPVEGGA